MGFFVFLAGIFIIDLVKNAHRQLSSWAKADFRQPWGSSGGTYAYQNSLLVVIVWIGKGLTDMKDAAHTHQTLGDRLHPNARDDVLCAA